MFQKEMETWLVIEPTGQKGKYEASRMRSCVYIEKALCTHRPCPKYSEAAYIYIGTLYIHTHMYMHS